MQQAKELTGEKKIAIVCMAIGPTLAAKILKYFTEAELERITTEIANTARVERERLEAVLDEFILLDEARQNILNGGMEYARQILERTVGSQKAAEIMRRLKEASKVKPFTFVRHADIKQLVGLISQEHPQTIAFILSYLDAGQAAQVVAELPQEIQSDIARRIATMDRTSPQVLQGVESVMRERLSTMFQQGYTPVGGLQSIVDILNNVDRGTEKLILEKLEKEDAELAEKIRQRMFIFEDIITLDDMSIQRVMRDLDTNDVALALKGASDDVKNRLLKNVSKRAAEILQENIEFLGPVRLREVEEAQQRIVETIRRLDENGEIIISRGGEDAVII